MKLTQIPALVGLLGALASPGTGAPHGTLQIGLDAVQERLEEARTALGWDQVSASTGLIRVVAKTDLAGSPSTQVIELDKRGRYSQSFEGALKQEDGSDGEVVWTVNWSGTPRLLGFEDRAKAEATAHLLHGTWCLPNAPFKFHIEGTGLRFLHSDGILEGQVILDPESKLPAEARFGETLLAFRGFGDHGGFRFPAHVEMTTTNVTRHFRVETLTLSNTPTAELDRHFTPKLTPPSDTKFDPKVAPALEVRRVPSGHLLVHPTLGGKDCGWFIFDTGAGINCIAEHVVKKGIFGDPVGSNFARGVGGDVAAELYRIPSFSLGPITVDRQVFMSLDLQFLEAHFGVPIGGIIGYELFARSTVEVDMADAVISLFDPSTYELPDSGTWTETILSGGHPHVNATLEGHDGVFKIDTGAAGDTVAVHYDFVQRHALLEGRESKLGSAGGVGGTVAAHNAQVRSFEFGGRKFENFDAQFIVEKKGVFANKYICGNIGGKLLEPFVMTFDYPHRRLGFTPK